MEKIAIIGGGISGLSVAQLLRDRYDVTVFEKEKTPGGLIRCKRIDGNLFHICGGHVFNSKRQDVLDWFWSRFNRDDEFSKTNRNSVVFMGDGLAVPYPIENHMYMFGQEIQQNFIRDLLVISQKRNLQPKHFEDFLRGRFGDTLYNLYFDPYNRKVWRRDLSMVPIEWLEGKLPMPTVEEMIYNNMNHVEERQFVHSSFWYEKKDGSQFLANRMAEGLNIRYEKEIGEIKLQGKTWMVNGVSFDKVVFCGNIKQLPCMLKGVNIDGFSNEIESLEYHGTTSVFCEIDANPYSWIYLPDNDYLSHRIICTGNFSPSNNVEGKMTATVEFTDEISLAEIEDNLKKIPLRPKYITHHYSKYTYPIQGVGTRKMIDNLQSLLAQTGFYMTGRFAHWEYYNMDVAIGAAMDLCKKLRNEN